MRLTTKGRFAVTALLDLAMQHSSGPVTLADISQRQKISLSYLEQLFAKLRQRELVDSVRGPGGGYCLAKSLIKYLSPISSWLLMNLSTIHVAVEKKIV